MSATATPGRNVQLDALRGIAILSVMLHHIAWKFVNKSPLGWGGVRFFFVLSGFLITGILLEGRELVRSGRQSSLFTLRQFYMRRFLRIFPIFYLMLAILALCNAGEVREHFFWHFTYLSNFRFILDGYFHDWVGHFWTLAVEEQFYLLWPAVVLCVPPRYLAFVVSLFIGVGLTYRYVAAEYGFSGLACEVMPLACVDTLAAGSLLAVLLHESRTSPQWRARYAIAGWIGVAGMITDMVLHHFDLVEVPRFVFGEVALSLFAIGVISRATIGYSGVARSVLEFKPLVYIGTISYGLYVYHAIVQSFVDVLIESHRVFQPSAEFRMVIEFGLSFFIAAFSWRFFERPINRLKRFFPYEHPLEKEPSAADAMRVSPIS